MYFRLPEEARNIDITLRVQGWHVLGHAVTITTKDGRLALLSPEPGQIAAVYVPLYVHGRAPGDTTVTLRLLDSTSGDVLNQQIVPTVNGEFSYAFDLAGITVSELAIEAQAGEVTLRIPFSLDIYGR